MAWVTRACGSLSPWVFCWCAGTEGMDILGASKLLAGCSAQVWCRVLAPGFSLVVEPAHVEGTHVARMVSSGVHGGVFVFMENLKCL